MLDPADALLIEMFGKRAQLTNRDCKAGQAGTRPRRRKTKLKGEGRIRETFDNAARRIKTQAGGSG